MISWYVARVFSKWLWNGPIIIIIIHYISLNILDADKSWRVLWILYFVLCIYILYDKLCAWKVLCLQSPVSTLQSTVYSLQSPVSTLQSTVSSLHSPVYSLQSPVSTLQSTVYSLHSPLYSLQSTVYSLSIIKLIFIFQQYEPKLKSL
jgi:hypothetical protein